MTKKGLVNSNERHAFLRGGLGNLIHLKIDCSLRQQSAAHRGSRVNGDLRFRQHYALEVCVSSNSHHVSDLPKDVLGQGAAGQSHMRSAGLDQLSSNLEDPHIARSTR